ncbi:60S ribosomal protein L23a-like [Rhinolophus ferrumequinum]|uniref:60S ribosomal protein L23a-like n=1 Tax=Rhinolophus ferrumequinum TaxID=59479 RepID=UPI00140FE8B5|nr:60S ribosomal protein L23a-like [Rhinolophus ferrumequinum]
MARKSKKEAPAPPKAEAKVKALNAKKAVLKGLHSHEKKEIRMSPTFQRPKTLPLTGSANILTRAPPVGTSLTTVPSSTSPNYRVSHEEDRRQQYTVSTADVKANKHHIKQAVKKLHDIDVAKVKDGKVMKFWKMVKKIYITMSIALI